MTKALVCLCTISAFFVVPANAATYKNGIVLDLDGPNDAKGPFGQMVNIKDDYASKSAALSNEAKSVCKVIGFVNATIISYTFLPSLPGKTTGQIHKLICWNDYSPRPL